MLLKTDGSIGSAMIFGFASFLFVFALHVISVFEQPFRPGSHSADKVSLFLLHEFVTKMHTDVDASAPEDPRALVTMPRRDARVA
jgi:hypothetical protein